MINHRASIIILSWKRPENIRRILDVETRYQCVNEVIVFNNNAASTLRYSHPKVKTLNASCDFGLRTRWIAAALAINDAVILHDDDLLLPEATIRRLVKGVITDPQRAYSLHGRVTSSDDDYRKCQKALDQADIVLTRATAINRDLIPILLFYEAAFRRAGFRLPKNNGEDIFLSYCLTYCFGKRHKILRLPHTKLPDHDAISCRPNHYHERTEVLRVCKEFFSSSGKRPAESDDLIFKAVSNPTNLPENPKTP